MRHALGSALLSLCMLACSPREPAGPTAAEVRAVIEASNAKFGEAVRAGDAAAIGALYTPDGAVLPPGAPTATGTAAVSAFWGASLAAGLSDATLTTGGIAYSGGEFATEIGSATLGTRDGGTTDGGKYMVLWKQTPDGWRMHRDIWNANVSPEPAPPAAAASGPALDGATPEAAPAQAAP